MGYTDITLGGSDGAADIYYSVREESKKASLKIIKILKRELKADHSCYNTQGATNVAMVLTEGDFKDVFLVPESRDLVEATIAGMNELIEKAKGPDAWDDLGNRDWHMKRWRELIRKLKHKLKKLPETDEEWDDIWC